MNKYKNVNVMIGTIKFDSIAEARRFQELKLLEKAGEISCLKLQPRYLLQEGFKKNGKTYRKIEYVADFRYVEGDKIIIEDVKSKATRTEVYKIKKKLFEKKYPHLTIKEIE